MSTCISSHGEYDAHETDPNTYVCKWCHEFDETGAMAEIARLRRGPVTGMEHAIEQAAQVVDDILRRDPQVAREMFGDEPDRIARALAEAGLIAPAPLCEEWTVIYVDPPYGTSIPMDESHARSLATRNDTLTRRYVTDPEVVR